ncbi:MAG: zinc transport system permease protein [Thermosediminibacterales bacterium]|nr:zinc transport system permease protein [Thermosediminibacterales bacterium]MDK2835355.1 zinc transport system permease protein [Thermosediminibacterales bacterium]
MIKAVFQYNFLQNAFLSAILASIVCGIIGTIIMERRLVMMSGGIAHTSFGGIGMGYFLNIEPIIGGLIFAVIASLSIVLINKKTRTDSDVLIGMFWAVGMAMGILFIALTPGYPPDMTSYLFGDILTVSMAGLKLMVILDIIILFVVVSLFDYWKAFLFDEEFANVLGIKTMYLEYTMFVLIALTVVVLIKVVGIILVIALLTIPPATAKLFVYDLKKIMIISIVLGGLFCLLGLVVSYQFNIASGATIILLSAMGYFMAMAIKKVINNAGLSAKGNKTSC